MWKILTLLFFIFCLWANVKCLSLDRKVDKSGPEFLAVIQNDSAMLSDSLVTAIIGGLLYLDKKQVKDHRYKTVATDFSRDQIIKPYISSILRALMGSYLVEGNHPKGNWPGFIDFMPTRISNKAQPWFTAVDYNSYITASTALCLRNFSDTLMPEKKQFISNMKLSAVNSLSEYRRNEAINFWPVSQNHSPSYRISKPANIPLPVIKILKYSARRFGLFEYTTMEEIDLFAGWLRFMHDKKQNPAGAASLFNIPNDSDDSSLVLAMLYLYGYYSEEDTVIMKNIMKFRDIGRTKADRRNDNIGPETGAFLTWQKTENAQVFSSPEKGIIPLATNNVDLIVNSNIILAMGLSGNTDNDAFKSAVTLVTRAIRENLWKEVSIYYPEKLFFAYAFSRAVKESGLHIPEIDTVLPLLMKDLIQEQMLFEQKHPELQGAFAPFDSINTVLATAIGLNAMLNLGKNNAAKAGMEQEYEEIITHSVNFLIKQRREVAGFLNNKKQPMYYWPSGVLFASSISELAYWYSDGLTTGIVIEALSQYAIESKNSHQRYPCKKLNICFENDIYTIK